VLLASGGFLKSFYSFIYLSIIYLSFIYIYVYLYISLSINLSVHLFIIYIFLVQGQMLQQWVNLLPCASVMTYQTTYRQYSKPLLFTYKNIDRNNQQLETIITLQWFTGIVGFIMLFLFYQK